MRTLAVWFVVVPAAVAAPGDVGTPEHARAAELVKQLGHNRYPVREAAAKQLLEMGGAAAAALREGQKSADEEVRAKCVALLPRAVALDWERKAAAYLADADGTQKHDLPLLAAFEKMVGKPDAEARKLFAAMLKANGPLFETAATDPKAAPKALADRVRILQESHLSGNAQVKMDPAEIASVLLVQSLVKERAAAPTDWRNVPGRLLSNPGVADAIGTAAFRKVVAGWAAALPSGENMSSQFFCMAARKYSIPEATPALIKAATDKTANAMTVRVIAVEALGKAGGAEATAALESILTDETAVINFNNGGGETYLIGDAALAALVAIHKKDRKDYGFGSEMNIGFAFGNGNRQDDVIMLNLIGFMSTEARKKAVEKWKTEKARGKDAAPKGKEEAPKKK
ncbi:MAG TPA: HEAT repeat domain-containing protein [Gemmataceae bacterium]|jgi:hypothetical protein|nr:HEAT repeat domain-containing protein [Gemmataceae bacterium]